MVLFLKSTHFYENSRLKLVLLNNIVYWKFEFIPKQKFEDIDSFIKNEVN